MATALSDVHHDWIAEIFGVDPRSFEPGGGPGEAPPAAPAAPPGSGTPSRAEAMDAQYQAALAKGDWRTGAEIVNGFSPADLKARIAKLSAGDVALLHKGAIDNPKVGQNSAVALATAAIVRPLVGPAQAKRATVIEQNLSAEETTSYHALLDGAKTEKQKSYLTKALAAGHSIAQIKEFNAKIAGKDETWLQDNLSLTGNSSGKGVKQQWSMSCNATAQEAVRAEMDPIYALSMHEANPDVTDVDEDDGAKKNPVLAAEQKALLESSYPDGKKGGTAVSRHGPKAPGRWNTDLLNNVEGSTGISYKEKKIGPDVSLADGVKQLNAGIDQGMPVPIVIGDGGANVYAHYVVVTGSDPGPPRYYSIHDPASGDTVVRSEEQLKTGNLGLGWTKLSAIETPSAIELKSGRNRAGLMRDHTRAELLALTPSRYLAQGFLDPSGRPLGDLSSLYATAAANQLLAGGLAVQELAFLVNALEMVLPLHRGAARERLREATREACHVVERMIGQANNRKLVQWLVECSLSVTSEADIAALTGHLAAVLRQYAVIAAFAPDASSSSPSSSGNAGMSGAAEAPALQIVVGRDRFDATDLPAIDAAVLAANRQQRLPGLADALTPALIDPAKAKAFLAALTPEAGKTLQGRALFLSPLDLGISFASPTTPASFPVPIALTVTSEHADGMVIAQAAFATDCGLARQRAATARGATEAADREIKATEQPAMPSATGARQRRFAAALAWVANATAYALCQPDEPAAEADRDAARLAAKNATFLGGSME